MENKNNALSDDVIIEIIHSIKEILVELINKAFPKENCSADIGNRKGA